MEIRSLDVELENEGNWEDLDNFWGCYVIGRLSCCIFGIRFF